jgi:hypothetical protein
MRAFGIGRIKSIGWVGYQNMTVPAYGRKTASGRSAEFVYNHINCPPVLLWLADKATIAQKLLFTLSLLRTFRLYVVTPSACLPRLPLSVSLVEWSQANIYSYGSNNIGVVRVGLSYKFN